MHNRPYGDLQRPCGPLPFKAKAFKRNVPFGTISQMPLKTLTLGTGCPFGTENSYRIIQIPLKTITLWPYCVVRLRDGIWFFPKILVWNHVDPSDFHRSNLFETLFSDEFSVFTKSQTAFITCTLGTGWTGCSVFWKITFAAISSISTNSEHTKFGATRSNYPCTDCGGV